MRRGVGIGNIRVRVMILGFRVRVVMLGFRVRLSLVAWVWAMRDYL